MHAAAVARAEAAEQECEAATTRVAELTTMVSDNKEAAGRLASAAEAKAGGELEVALAALAAAREEAEMWELTAKEHERDATLLRSELSNKCV